MVGDFKSQDVVLKLVDGTQIRGRIRLREGPGLGATRLSDLINSDDDPFIILFDVDYREELGKVLFVNKSHIVWMSPLDAGGSS